MSRMRPPLTTSITGTANDAVFFLDLLDRAPGPLVLGPLLREDQPAFLVLLLEDERLDLVAEVDDLRRVDVVADRQLTGGDDPLGLVTDVEQDLVAVDLDHRALDDLAVLDLHHRCGVGLFERHAPEVVFHHLSRRVVVTCGRIGLLGGCGGCSVGGSAGRVGGLVGQGDRLFG